MGANITSSPPLQAAAHENKAAAVEYLLSVGADINQLAGATGYALHAAAGGSVQGSRVMKMLVDHGADPNALGGEDGTALQSAASQGCLANIKFLLSVGADPTIEGGKHGTPLKAAMAYGWYHVVNYLRRYMAAKEKDAGLSQS